MTVAELIQRLQAIRDQTLEVYAWDGETQFAVETVDVEQHHSEPAGPYIVVLS